MKINVPNGRGVAVFDVPDANLLGVYESSVNRVAPPTDAVAEVVAAIEHPIGSPRLRELAKGQRNIVIIAVLETPCQWSIVSGVCIYNHFIVSHISDHIIII